MARAVHELPPHDGSTTARARTTFKPVDIEAVREVARLPTIATFTLRFVEGATLSLVRGCLTGILRRRCGSVAGPPRMTRRTSSVEVCRRANRHCQAVVSSVARAARIRCACIVNPGGRRQDQHSDSIAGRATKLPQSRRSAACVYGDDPGSPDILRLASRSWRWSRKTLRMSAFCSSVRGGAAARIARTCASRAVQPNTSFRSETRINVLMTGRPSRPATFSVRAGRTPCLIFRQMV